MLRFFNVYIRFESEDEEYVEPANNPKELIKNILRYELFDTSHPTKHPLKYFIITKK